MKSRNVVCRIVLCGFLLVPMSSLAVPVSYDESSDGELSFVASDTSLNLDTGINTVAGTISAVSEAAGDLDSFTFLVPMDASLTDLSLALGVPDIVGSVAQGEAEFTLEGVTETFSVLSAATLDLFNGVLPLNEGSYELDQTRSVIGFPFGTLASWEVDYTWQLTVEASSTSVPVPATLLLFGIGIAALGFSRCLSDNRASGG